MARLDVDVGINNAAFRAGLDQMRAGAARLKGDLVGMFSGAIGLAGLAAAVKSTINYADKVDDLSKRFKVGTDELQRFGLAADRNGSSFDAAAGSLNKLAISTSKALQGDEKLIDAFKDLNVTVDDLIGKSPEDIMRLIGTSSMEATSLVAILGKSSLELRDALAALSDEGEDFGDVMSGSVVTGLADVQDKIERVTQTIAVNLGGALIWAIGYFENFVAAFAAMGNMMVANATATGQVLKKVFSGDFAGVKNVVDNWKREIAALDQAFREFRAENNTEKPEDGGSDDGSKRTFTDDDADKQGEKDAQKREDRLQKIRDAEAEAARAALEGQQKINSLIEERNRLLEIYKTSDDEDAGIDALEKAQRIQRQIETEETKQAEKKKKSQDEIATKKVEEAQAEVDRAERLAVAITDERQAREDDIISTLEGDKKVKALELKKSRMEQEAKDLEATDPEAASRKRTDIIGVSAQIRDEKESIAENRKKEIDDAAKKKKDAKDAKLDAAASVSVSSLQAVGGGGGRVGGTADPILRANEQQVNLLREIKAELAGANQRGSRKEADPWR